MINVTMNKLEEFCLFVVTRRQHFENDTHLPLLVIHLHSSHILSHCGTVFVLFIDQRSVLCTFIV